LRWPVSGETMSGVSYIGRSRVRPFTATRFACVVAIGLLAGCTLDPSGVTPGGGSGSGTTSSAGGGDTTTSTSIASSTGATGVGGAGVGGQAGANGEGGDGGQGGQGGAPAVCGDMVVGPGEECDDGNAQEGDGCNLCHLDCGCPGCQAGTACPSCPAIGQLTYKSIGSGRCYLYQAAGASWTTSRETCTLWGGDLAALSTAGEMSELANPQIITAFAGQDPNARCWTGGNEIGNPGQYAWSNGEPWLLPDNGGPSFAPGEPGGPIDECFVIDYSGTLRDRACADPFGFLCER
jgi:cysteine-rich repeat protein